MSVQLAGYPDNLQPWSIQVLASVTALAIVAVGLRLLSRYEKRQALWWDDWMIIFSLVWNIVVVGFICGMLQHGMGIHAEHLPVEDIVTIAKFLVVAEVLYVFNLVWTKLSFLLMFYRIFRFPYFRRWAYVIGTFVLLWVVCITFLFIFICVPVEKLWYPDLPGRCIDQVGTWIANAASTILSDLAILVLPIPQVWSLQLRRTDKLTLSLCFGLGFFVIFASAYRFTVLFSYSPLDPSYTLAPTVGWTAIEMSAGIVSACLPTIVPAFRLIGRKVGLSNLSWRSAATKEGGEGDSAPQKGTIGSGGSSSAARQEGGRRSVRARDGDRDFVRLSDEGDGGTAARDESDDDNVKLRPDLGVAYTVTSVPGGKDGEHSESGDEIPLRSIRVQRDFEQVRS